MSEEDLRKRLTEYGGDDVTLKRIALIREHLRTLPSFPATDERMDPQSWRLLLGARRNGLKRSSRLH
jgi:hypothetical protein